MSSARKVKELTPQALPQGICLIVVGTLGNHSLSTQCESYPSLPPKRAEKGAISAERPGTVS